MGIVGHFEPRPVANDRLLKLCLWVAALFAALLITSISVSGSLAHHMARHIALMNVVAPFAALAAMAVLPSRPLSALSRGHMLILASVTQIAVLWASHAPAVLAIANSAVLSHSALQALLLIAALWFWASVFAQPLRQFWRALFALLLTGKLFCLLGALLVFAPRSLYPLHAHGSLVGGLQSNGLEDQQLAGLLMLLACPLSYLVAGVVVSSRAIRALDAGDDAYGPPPGHPIRQ